MIIQNRTEEFREELQELYQEKVATVLREAEIAAKSTKDSFLAQVKEKLDLVKSQRTTEFKGRCGQQIASMRLESDGLIANAKAELLDILVLELKKQINLLDPKQKNIIAKKMYLRVQKKIREQGFKLSEFTISVWKGANVTSAKATLSELAVRAESSQVVVEDSIDDFLQSHHNDIIRVISRHVEENLE